MQSETSKKQFQIIDKADISAKDFRTACMLLDHVDDGTGIIVADAAMLERVTDARTLRTWVSALKRLAAAGVLKFEPVAGTDSFKIQGMAWINTDL